MTLSLLELYRLASRLPTNVGGAIFQLEKEKWDTRIKIALDETVDIVESWINENG